MPIGLSSRFALLKLRSMLEAGLPIDAAMALIDDDLALLDESLRFRLRSLCAIAFEFGGSIAAGIEALLLGLDQTEQLKQEIATAKRQPLITSRLILWMPIASLLLAQIIGVKVFGLAARQPAIAMSMAIGVVLMLANRRFAAKRLGALDAEVSKLINAQDGFGEALARISAGAPLAAEVTALAAAAESAQLLSLLQLADEYGLAASAFIKSTSDLKHAQAVGQIKIQIASLQTRLLAPLALLALPVLAFLAFIPVVMTLITN